MSELTPDTVEDVLKNLVKTGGPAFPSKMTTLETEFHGLTLRDYCASAALTGLIAKLTEETYSDVPEAASVCAEAAYLFADAMLAERSK